MGLIFTPDLMLHTYGELTPGYLLSKGIRAILTDLDNTLAPYEQPEPDQKIRDWIRSMEENGIRVAIVSNNDPERVERFNRTLGLPAFPKAGKPKKKAMKAACRALGVEPRDCCALGDQLLTDSWAGHRMHMLTVIVPPIRDKLTWFFRLKRQLERPFMRKYKKMHPEWNP